MHREYPGRFRTKATSTILAMRRRLDEYGAEIAPRRHTAGTQVQYSSAERQWRAFCKACGYHWKDWSPQTTFHFACWRRTAGGNMRTGAPVKANTIRSQLSGIRAALINHGLNPTEYAEITMPRTHALLRAIAKRESGNFKLALSGTQLRRMCSHLPRCHDTYVLQWALYLMHNTLRRVGEVMPKYMPPLTAGDILWDNGSYHPRRRAPLDTSASYHFYRSKTNQSGKLQTAYMWCRCDANDACALCALRRLFQHCPWPINRHTPLLLLTSGKILNYTAALRRLKKLCKAIGLEPNHYGLHSLRRGGFHDAQDEGHSDALINAQAHWAGNRSRLPYDRSRGSVDAKKAKQVAAIPKGAQSKRRGMRTRTPRCKRHSAARRRRR